MLDTYRTAEYSQGDCQHKRIDILVWVEHGMDADNLITLHWRSAPNAEPTCTLELCTTKPRLLSYAQHVALQVGLRRDLSWQEAMDQLTLRGYRRIGNRA